MAKCILINTESQIAQLNTKDKILIYSTAAQQKFNSVSHGYRLYYYQTHCIVLNGAKH